MDDRFKVFHHEVIPGKMMVEFWREGKFVASIYPHDDGIRIVSKYMTGVSEDNTSPRSAVIRLEV